MILRSSKGVLSLISFESQKGWRTSNSWGAGESEELEGRKWKEKKLVENCQVKIKNNSIKSRPVKSQLLAIEPGRKRKSRLLDGKLNRMGRPRGEKGSSAGLGQFYSLPAVVNEDDRV